MNESKMTELEKRWAEEEAEETLNDTISLQEFIEKSCDLSEKELRDAISNEEDGCCGSCSHEHNAEDEDMSSFETENFIAHPFSDPFMPLAIVESGIKTYMCGLAELDPATQTCVVVDPMLFQEQMFRTSDAPNEEPKLSVMFRLPYITVGCMDSLHLKYDALYLMKNNKEGDMRLASSYEENYNKTRIAQSNLVAPSMSDIAKVNG